ncbi:MAG: endolytic transglycosylase MltG [Gammaproteobacteria bacterium]|nr:endolytic transglycosylase MltG [Gammaproteobacteria bacterium]
MLKKLVLLLVFSISAALVAYGWMQWHRWHEAPLPIDETTVVQVAPGTALSRLAERLASDGIIESDMDLKILARLEEKAARIQAGEYRVEPGTTLAGLLDMMVSGEVLLHSLTIVEGMNFRELQQRVNAHGALAHELSEADGAAVMAAIGKPDMHPEGRFLPETYHFPRGLTDTEFYRRAAKALDEILAIEWENREDDLPYDSPYDALIMASIIEKETAIPEERDEIAGVFVRRLEKGMRLQTDPTVIYGLGEDYTGDITYRNLRTDTPYNTYTRGGLPPTPIAMPGVDAIHAAMHPAEGDSLYFVATEGGRHHFSSTLEEHNRMVRKWQSRRKPLDEEDKQ